MSLAAGRIKEFLSIVLFTAFLLSCDISIPVQATDFDDAHAWVVLNIAYEADTYDEWQTPDETIERGAGDCEDSAILLSAMCREIGISTSLFIIRMPDVYHMVVEHDGSWYSGTELGTMPINEESIVFSFTLNEALIVAAIK